MKIGILNRGDREIMLLAAVMILTLSMSLWSKDLLDIRPMSFLVNAVIFFLVAVPLLAISIIKRFAYNYRHWSLNAAFDEISNAEWQQRTFGTFAIICSLIAFMPFFSAMKGAVPLFNAYSWDPYFIDLDRQLHGGDPWMLLQPILGFPLVTSILSVFYHVWLVLLYGVAIFFAFRAQQPDIRRRYFLSYFILWPLLGVVLAIAFASVGPCFVEPILGRSDFVPLMDYLRTANNDYPVHVLRVQDMLLEGYRQSDNGIGSGITAMPSMHVSQALLFFIAMRHVSRFAAWLFGVFFVLIFIGSIHLGYHYAVDGYLSILVTVLIWKLSGWWTSYSREAGTSVR